MHLNQADGDVGKTLGCSTIHLSQNPSQDHVLLILLLYEFSYRKGYFKTQLLC